MLQDDSNGESSFEFVDKKNQGNNNAEKTESLGTLSSVSSAYSIPSPSLVNLPSGNLFNVLPPSSIPDFTIWPSTTLNTTASSISPPTTQAIFTQPQPTVATAINALPLVGEQFPAAQFSAAIPPSKGIHHGPISQQPVNENEHFSGGFMGLFKDAFSSGVLSKMAEKAKNSVDSIITTLDPQMSGYIYSSGDTEVTVTSDNEEEVVAIREAFHAVFGKAWSQAIGCDDAIKNAEEKIAYSMKFRNTPSVAIENVLLLQANNWFDLSILLLKDKEKQISIQILTQATPVPVEKILKEIETEKLEYKALSTEEKIGTYLQTKPNWQLTVTGLSRKEILLQAGKALVKMYKDQLSLVK
ncbi:hypothetical protein NQ317_002993 [Molorchus minor]|uniref:Uncharacterized protein n=1 Tax=Molorchus minor TaxID=1323400 RepID=A0ABQ9JMK3_9CUCU|nr:hypothetical protein NQ317_002993 [Molorchus minor]